MEILFTVRVAHDEEDQDLLDELFLILAFSGSVVVVTLMLYVVVRLLDWSRSKLPFEGRPLVYIAVVCLVGLLVSALLAGVQFTGPFRGINDSLLRLSESADIVALGLAVFALVLVFRLITVRHER